MKTSVAKVLPGVVDKHMHKYICTDTQIKTSLKLFSFNCILIFLPLCLFFVQTYLEEKFMHEEITWERPRDH